MNLSNTKKMSKRPEHQAPPEIVRPCLLSYNFWLLLWNSKLILTQYFSFTMKKRPENILRSKSLSKFYLLFVCIIFKVTLFILQLPNYRHSSSDDGTLLRVTPFTWRYTVLAARHWLWVGIIWFCLRRIWSHMDWHGHIFCYAW